MKGRYLEGEVVQFRDRAQRQTLVGRRVCYLRGCDIDKSGRSYLFPRYDFVEEVTGRYLLLDGGTCVTFSELVEIQVLPG